MRKRTAVAAGTVALAAAVAGGGAAIAGGLGTDMEHVTGPDARHAEQAALDATGGGTANSVERDDENGATWEVEVTKPDGVTVDVRLDETFAVVVIEGDSDGGADDESDG